MAKHLETGRLGEAIALRLLEEKRYIIHELNWKHQHKEVDIIAQEGQDMVFVEVKTRRSQSHGSALQAVDNAKQRNIIEAANRYMSERRLPYNTRFDVIAIDFDAGEQYRAEHIVNAYYATPQVLHSHSRKAKFNKNRIPKIR